MYKLIPLELACEVRSEVMLSYWPIIGLIWGYTYKGRTDLDRYLDMSGDHPVEVDFSVPIFM